MVPEHLRLFLAVLQWRVRSATTTTTSRSGASIATTSAASRIGNHSIYHPIVNHGYQVEQHGSNANVTVVGQHEQHLQHTIVTAQELACIGVR
uniref:Putative secreted peptide n=1 Tax=Anopheles braziliensis TaxID=58242 RepID=A0A2M3ZUP3_9DIPT